MGSRWVLVACVLFSGCVSGRWDSRPFETLLVEGPGATKTAPEKGGDGVAAPKPAGPAQAPAKDKAPAPAPRGGPPPLSFSRVGPYLALAGIYSIPAVDWGDEGYMDGLGDIHYIDDIAPQSLGFGLRLGYRIAPALAVELSYEEKYYEFVTDYSSFDAGATDVVLQAKLFASEGNVQPYALFGFGSTDFWDDYGYWYDGATGSREDFSESGFLLRVGFGMDVYFSPEFGGFLELNYNLTTSERDHGDILFGLLLRF